ncbi:MAG: hypothetical protein O9301_14645 [Leptospira sp.]|nr:hypothetical protein [Leptospira sp.]
MNFLKISVLAVLSLSFCQKSAKQRFDVFYLDKDFLEAATLCELETDLKTERQNECAISVQSVVEEIETITTRPLQMGISSVLVEKSRGEKIEKLLRLSPRLGIRYLEIWKQTVILE